MMRMAFALYGLYMEELLLTLRKEAAGTSCGLALGIVQTASACSRGVFVDVVILRVASYLAVIGRLMGLGGPVWTFSSRWIVEDR